LQVSFSKGISNEIGGGVSGLLSDVLVSYGCAAVGADEGVV
jgi:hypothetical protein